MFTIKECIQEMNHFFYSRQTYDIEKRIYFLKKFKKNILIYQKEIEKALYMDFKKPSFETYVTEIYTVMTELNEALKSIRKWAAPKRMSGALPVLGSHTKIIKEPYGVCAIFSPYNYPFQLACAPLIGALAAGNCAIIKPSEYTPATNKVLKKIIAKTFPPYYVKVIEGDAQVAQEILKQPIDYIFFTGGVETGKSVMKQASENLIPVTLELGGKSPTVVDYDADLKLAAKRIIWGKFLNAGQTCVAPDYVLVHESVANQLLCYMRSILQQFYSTPKEMAHIINELQYVRLLQLINEDKIYFGGHFDTDALYIEPTLLYPICESDLCMQEEIFGPILPIIPFKRLEEAVHFVQRRPKPLACYIFSNDKKRINYLLKHISFGGGCINDTILHLTHPSVPFGGVGYSGMGTYHGYHSFKTFTHEKAVFISRSKELPFRYPPYHKKLPIIKKLIR